MASQAGGGAVLQGAGGEHEAGQAIREVGVEIARRAGGAINLKSNPYALIIQLEIL